MPLLVVCLLPAAPVLLPRLTGSRVPEVEPLREAAREALAALADLDRVVVVTDHAPGTLAGFGAPGSGPATGADPPAPAATDGPGASWTAELAEELLDGSMDGSTDGSMDGATDGATDGGPRPRTGGPLVREHRSWAGLGDLADPGGLRHLVTGLDRDPARVGLLLLADGSRTRGPRAPGGEDPRGDAVDAELLLALRQGRPADAPDAAAVGATAVDAVALVAAAPGGPTVVLHHEAPLGVGYLVAVRRAAPRSSGGARG